MLQHNLDPTNMPCSKNLWGLVWGSQIYSNRTNHGGWLHNRHGCWHDDLQGLFWLKGDMDCSWQNSKDSMVKGKSYCNWEMFQIHLPKLSWQVVLIQLELKINFDCLSQYGPVFISMTMDQCYTILINTGWVFILVILSNMD